GWDVVGGGPSVCNYFPADDSNNTARADLTVIDSSENIVMTTSGKKVALLGVENLIVVETEDALLVANRDDADGIKKLVDLMPEELI
ncbi:MAG: mannose-1-phosphate guanyltransferase, partial [Verrucomicrobiota bacterium]